MVYQDAELVVIDKPAGIAAHPGPGLPGQTLVNGLLALCTDIQGVGGEISPGIVHRLGGDTSGWMIAAQPAAPPPLPARPPLGLRPPGHRRNARVPFPPAPRPARGTGGGKGSVKGRKFPAPSPCAPDGLLPFLEIQSEIRSAVIMVVALVLARVAPGITEASITRRLTSPWTGQCGLTHMVYQDAELVVMDLPAGIAAHPGPGLPGQTLVNGPLSLCPDIQDIGGEIRPGIVHRLDKDTSGWMIAAQPAAPPPLPAPPPPVLCLPGHRRNARVPFPPVP